ncbi:tripartite tricarboxylate transporter substrate-binding protein [Halomonas casei]|uniref:tripartite tricarboxylate transporter substrate-binding protein n=1 Tax=Halomonas TaxID=2745 RepID=UPI001D02A457|nr:tripartite tricarboxylate transporter substrate-binding protein [Halomonas casei]
MPNTYRASLSLTMKSLLVGATATIAALAIALPAAAEDFPSRPLNMVVGFGTGGSADRLARIMSGPLSEEIGVPIQVTNRPGAGTQVASNYVLNVPDDGYTVYASTFAPYFESPQVS